MVIEKVASNGSCIRFFPNTATHVFFEDENGYVYKLAAEDKQRAFLDCWKKPECLAVATYLKSSQPRFHLFEIHNENTCPPNDNKKLQIHFEETLKEEMIKEENKGKYYETLYKKVRDQNQYKTLQLEDDHVNSFNPICVDYRNKYNAKRLKAKKAAASSSTSRPHDSSLETDTLGTQDNDSHKQVCLRFQLISVGKHCSTKSI